jgi:hypothetical protein
MVKVVILTLLAVVPIILARRVIANQSKLVQIQIKLVEMAYLAVVIPAKFVINQGVKLLLALVVYLVFNVVLLQIKNV